MKYVHPGTLVLLGLWSLGCASTPPPNDKVASTQAAVQSAEEVGAREVPQASMHLQLAQDELERAKGLMRNGDNQEASDLLTRAQADADLALAMARENKTRVAAQEAKARVQALRSGAAPGSAVGGGPSAPPAPPPQPAPPSHPAPGAPSAKPPAPPSPSVPPTPPPSK